jgi:predicted nicotinamide N-methyase
MSVDQRPSPSSHSGEESPGHGLVHVVKCGKVRATVRMLPLQQESIEPYKGNQHSQGGFQTGQYLWDSGVYLARWLLGNRERLRNRRVVELGSGLGLPGLTAAKFAAETLLTDCAADLVSNLSAAALANGYVQEMLSPVRAPVDAAGGGGAGAGLAWDKPASGPPERSADEQRQQSSVVAPPQRVCRACLLDWTHVVAAAIGPDADAVVAARGCNADAKAAGSSLPEAARGGFDVVLASDCIYMVNMAPLVARVVAALLREGGIAVLVFPEGRPGVQEFLDLMRRWVVVSVFACCLACLRGLPRIGLTFAGVSTLRMQRQGVTLASQSESPTDSHSLLVGRAGLPHSGSLGDFEVATEELPAELRGAVYLASKPAHPLLLLARLRPACGAVSSSCATVFTATALVWGLGVLAGPAFGVKWCRGTPTFCYIRRPHKQPPGGETRTEGVDSYGT